ncbi:hypothetical protein GCM10010954_34920 [Halobacillus andaensis]|uniref:Uncharacterized protein n=1 Tax=Halobacillus andaensis TaxID=1176239 RepID=A0A917BA06_HALAA|nr:hypothetical protein [Halobacillus andaensis]MBP2005600.1 preprotein translocase subunit YajC [Halobacillus andaensis]GGF32763.1 hypothetical protein GCM10010954_34920 [Halobacillus andaensis]
MMEFLYFPTDKSEYIPAVLMLAVFILLAGITMYFIIKASRKEEKKTENFSASQTEHPTKHHH